MAATAYESVVSLRQTIDHVMEHGRNSFALNYEQIQSVYQKAGFLVDFLESYSGGDSKEVNALEIQIADAAHAAEDIIEFKVVDYIRDNQSTSFDRTMSSPLCHRLRDAVRAMDLVKNKAMENKGKRKRKVQLPKYLMPSSSSSSVSSVSKDIMVGFDDVLIQMMDRLTRQQESTRLIIPISGMGGIGKTTLTRNVYENPYIMQHFDLRSWITISQDYELKGILTSLLIEFNESIQGMNESQLGEKLHKHLFGRRYLIVMDDMWSIDAWDKVQRFFPENRNGSRVVITTRLTNMARHLGSCGLEVDFLDEDQSWNLLHRKVFGQQECTLELKEIGKEIAKNCKGLPLSIVVIAGLLAKSNRTPEHWYHVAKKVNSIINQADDGQCLKILSLSYENLPVHLKPCFLYMGVFPEDFEIKVQRLIQLWVAEGFLKPNRAKSLEEVAEDYLMELDDRSLFMVHQRELEGNNVKFCKIHDLLRDLCIREAKKEKFFCVAKSLDSSQALQNQRRVVIHKTEKDQILCNTNLDLLRSITWNTNLDLSFLGGRLTRVLNERYLGSSVKLVNLLNLRLIYLVDFGINLDHVFRSIANKLWNIQFLTLGGYAEPLDISDMKQLRYVMFVTPLVGVVDERQEDSNMKHLHTLMTLRNQTLSEGVVKMISNIKILGLLYEYLDKDKDCCLNNLQHLYKLEYLDIIFGTYKNDLQRNFVFPHSLKKLKLRGTYLSWEDMTIIGCLPNLEVLILKKDAFIGEDWYPIEGQFLSLKHLYIRMCNDLKVWNAESMHFPVLEKLFLSEMKKLKEIPLVIGETQILRFIEVKHCSDSVVRSAIAILDDQEVQGNDELQVKVWIIKKETRLQNLEARHNLEVCIRDYPKKYMAK